MATATDTDLQQLKDLITAGNIATQKQITDSNAVMQKQITDSNAVMQKQIADLAISTQQQFNETQKQIADLAISTQQQFNETQKQISKLEQRVEVGFAKVEGDMKNLGTKFDEKTKSLDQRITSKEFTIRGVTVAILGGLLLAFGKFLFFGKI
jgi:predicted  nucleic acid-binding Zn-ribbon protein